MLDRLMVELIDSHQNLFCCCVVVGVDKLERERERERKRERERFIRFILVKAVNQKEKVMRRNRLIV